jgi:hypothetical protein
MRDPPDENVAKTVTSFLKRRGKAHSRIFATLKELFSWFPIVANCVSESVPERREQVSARGEDQDHYENQHVAWAEPNQLNPGLRASIGRTSYSGEA